MLFAPLSGWEITSSHQTGWRLTHGRSAAEDIDPPDVTDSQVEVETSRRLTQHSVPLQPVAHDNLHIHSFSSKTQNGFMSLLHPAPPVVSCGFKGEEMKIKRTPCETINFLPCPAWMCRVLWQCHPQQPQMEQTLHLSVSQPLCPPLTPPLSPPTPPPARCGYSSDSCFLILAVSCFRTHQANM